MNKYKKYVDHFESKKEKLLEEFSALFPIYFFQSHKKERLHYLKEELCFIEGIIYALKRIEYDEKHLDEIWGVMEDEQ